MPQTLSPPKRKAWPSALVAISPGCPRPPFSARAACDGSQGNLEPGQAHLPSAKGGVLTQIPAGLWELRAV